METCYYTVILCFKAKIKIWAADKPVKWNATFSSYKVEGEWVATMCTKGAHGVVQMHRKKKRADGDEETEN